MHRVAVLTVFSLLFLLVKVTIPRGTVQVTVTNATRQYVARIPVTDQSQGGTAWRTSQLGLGDVLMAGKTGTAQVRNYDKGGSRGKGGVWGLRDHGLFVAYAPIDALLYVSKTGANVVPLFSDLNTPPTA